jgi:hypothetical protein
MKAPLFISVLFITASIAFAAGTSDTAAQLAAERLAVENARTAAQQNDPATAELLLASVNRSQPNTTWWHVETAQRLIQLAHGVRASRTSALPVLVTRALEHLVQAEALTADPRQKATARSLAGLVYERFRGDHAAALTSYRAAVQLDPASPEPRRAAERLERTADIVNARSRR